MLRSHDAALMPAGTDVTVERVMSAGVGPTTQPEFLPASVVRPTDPTKPVWLIRTPAETGKAEWLVTAMHRMQRPKPNEAKFRGPYGIGPYILLANSKHTGRINIYAGPSVRLSFKPLLPLP